MDAKKQQDINDAVDVMRRGGVILYPTDTVWGIGCDARNDKAIRRIFEIKKRAESKSMISLVGSLAMLERTVDNIPEVAMQIVELATTPITIIYDHPVGLSPLLRAEDGSAAIRLTNEPVSRALCLGLRAPVVSTSANISGQKTPIFFDEITPEIIEAVDYVCLSGRVHLDSDLPPKPSSIIKVSDGGLFTIIR